MIGLYIASAASIMQSPYVDQHWETSLHSQPGFGCWQRQGVSWTCALRLGDFEWPPALLWSSCVQAPDGGYRWHVQQLAGD